MTWPHPTGQVKASSRRAKPSVACRICGKRVYDLTVQWDRKWVHRECGERALSEHLATKAPAMVGQRRRATG